MNTYYPILKLLLPLIVGVYLSQWCVINSFSMPYVSIFTILISTLTIIFFLVFPRRNTIISIGIYTSFLLLGFSIHNESEISTKATYFGNLEGEYYSGKVIEVSSNGRFLKCKVDVGHVLYDWGSEESEGNLILYVDTAECPLFGSDSEIIFHAEVFPIQNNNNPGDFDAKSYWNNKGFYHQAFINGNQLSVVGESQARFSVFSSLNERMNRLLENNLEGDALGVAKGVLLGDKADIRMELKEAFSGAGAMHLLAVSGLHVGIFLVIIQWLMSVFLTRLPKWVELLILFVILWTYAGVTGFSPSVNRSVTMFSFVAFGMVYGKHYSSLNGLLASAFLLLIIEPKFLFDIGFQLSYLAMLGIFLFSGSIERTFFIKHAFIKKIWIGSSVALAAQLGTFPLTLYYFHQFPNYFLLTNLGLMIFSGVLLGVGLGLITLGAIPYVGIFIAFLMYLVVTALVYFIEWVNSLPYALTRGFQFETWEIVLMYLLIGVFLWSIMNARKRVLLVAVGITSVFVIGESIKWHQKYLKNEFLVLNSTIPTFLVTNGDKGTLIVLSSHEDIAQKSEFQIKSLQNYYGIEIDLLVVDYPKGEIRLKHPDIHITHSKDVIKIDGAVKATYVLGNYYDMNLLESNHKVILGNWISQVNQQSILSRLGEKQVHILKKNGAIKLY